MNFRDFCEGKKHSDEKHRMFPDSAVRQGNRLPLKNNDAMERRSKGDSAASDSPTKAEKGAKRKGTVSQPKGHPAAKRNQAYGGESEEQYNPKKYKAIKSELRDRGGKGQVKVPSKPPYKANELGPEKPQVVRGSASKVDREMKGEGGQNAVRKLVNKKLEKDFKKTAKKGEYPKIEEQVMNFSEYCQSVTKPLYEADGVPHCPPGYRFDAKQMMCVPKTEKDNVTNQKGTSDKKDMSPENMPGFNTIGSHGQNGSPHAYEESRYGPNPWGYKPGRPWTKKDDYSGAKDDYYSGNTPTFFEATRDYEKEDELEKKFKKDDARMKYGKAMRPSSLGPGEVRKPKK